MSWNKERYSVLLTGQSPFPLSTVTLSPQTTKEISSPKTDGRASLLMTMVTQLIERRKAKHGYSWGHRSSSFLCSSLSGGRRYSEGYRKRDWATIQKSSHKTFDLEASRLIICAAKIREPSINAFVLLSAHSFAFSSSLFWMGLLTSVSPMKKTFNFLLPSFLYHDGL